MSLNWKEINLILEELSLEGAQIQSAVQSAFDVIVFRLHKKGENRHLLISLNSNACRLHETFAAVPKSEKPLRFAQFLNSKIVNGRITKAVQLGDNRIVHLVVKRPDTVFNLYIRLWSNAANFIVTGEDGIVLDVMRRLPKRGEITGGHYTPQDTYSQAQPIRREYEVREIPGEGSFNKKIDAFYSMQKGTLSLETLREQAKRHCEGSIGRINAAIEKLREKEAAFSHAEQFKNYGDLILSNIASIIPEDKWLEIEEGGRKLRIELEPFKSPAALAGKYYEQYRKAKNGLTQIQKEITESEQELKEVNEKLNRLLSETNPLILAKLLKSTDKTTHIPGKSQKKEKTRPGLSFKRGDWLIIVGRDASENDELLRRHVNGNDLWLHTRDFHGSYVFIKHKSGKSFPLDIMLDAGNLALFYSKGRNNAQGDLFYTQVKYLRRAKNGPKGLVIPTQEKNLHIKLDETRLRVLENCKV
ncbi:MAG: NFACT RNA binding domain-containing protein [Treponema sp.]|jgi:predicted ribosome quality control (RQC) complex YloA/Tae2 family protein|nr:NFACT RNA binding domain-containing protein [Treponema sp.]